MHNLSLMTFPRVVPVAHKFVWPQRALKVYPSRSESSSQLTDFFLNHQNPPRTVPVHNVIHIPKTIFLSKTYFDICERHIHSVGACEHLRSNLHLTNPCAEPKGSQPN